MLLFTIHKVVSIALVGALMPLLCTCASSDLINLWHERAYQLPPLNNLLIIAVRKDPVKRRIWEDAFVSSFTQQEIKASSSYRLFSDAPPDTEQVIDAVREFGFDGVITIVNLPTVTTTRHVPGYITTEQHLRYNSYWGRYSTFYRNIEHPGYTDSQVTAYRTIEVSTTKNGGHLIWSGTSRTTEPGSVTDVQTGIARLVIDELTKHQLILKNPANTR